MRILTHTVLVTYEEDDDDSVWDFVLGDNKKVNLKCSCGLAAYFSSVTRIHYLLFLIRD